MTAQIFSGIIQILSPSNPFAECCGNWTPERVCFPQPVSAIGFRSPELLVSWETNMSIVKRILPLIAATFAATFTVFAQTDRGSIEGTVKDPNGAAVPSAKVQVVNIETNSKLDFQTNELGNYLASNLPVGSYRMIVQKEGFRTLVREPILVRAQSSLACGFHVSVRRRHRHRHRQR